jgi:DnaJ-domain-containing protein 1
MNFSMMDTSLLILFLLSCARQVQGDEDLYGVLGVGKTASLQEIKRAYKNLAKEW